MKIEIEERIKGKIQKMKMKKEKEEEQKRKTFKLQGKGKKHEVERKKDVSEISMKKNGRKEERMEKRTKIRE